MTYRLDDVLGKSQYITTWKLKSTSQFCYVWRAIRAIGPKSGDARDVTCGNGCNVT